MSLRVLHVVPTFYPATYWGGPIHSLYGLCNALGREGQLELRVLTTDAAGPNLNDRVEVTAFPVHSPAGYEIFYCRRIYGKEVSIQMLRLLWKMVGWADVVHLTATYSFPTIPTLVLCRIFNKPVVWSPRGALQASHEWAGARRRGLKWLWERVCLICMPHRTILHVTSETEKQTSLERLPRARAVVIPNGVDIPEIPSSRSWMSSNVLRIMFIGRLDPIKGIENLLQALKLLERQSVSLAIYGSGKPDYLRKLRAQAVDLGLEGTAKFCGHVEGAEKTKAFLDADVCVVPSFSENFAMVVAEALAHGIAVIASTGTPWQEIESKGAGKWVSNDPDTLAAAIASMRREDLATMGKLGREWMVQEFAWPIMAQKMLATYQKLSSGLMPALPTRAAP